MVRISDRLRTVAHMCEKGAVVADIGTDHGYLPIYLVQDGLEKLSANEADIITICGMGGRLIADIVTKGMNVITQNTTLIVSPQSEVGDFRHFLVSQRLVVDDEKMLKEDGKYYFIIKCRKSDENVYSEYSETQYQYGWKLLENKDKTLYEYLIKEKETNDGISNR